MIVLANGTFDPFHVGHLFHLLAARKMGDKLIVSVTDDENVRREKGDKRPVFKQDERAFLLRNLSCVDGVVIVANSMQALVEVRPNIFVKGIEYRNKIRDADRAFCEAYGIKIRFTDEPVYSSTKMLKHYESRRG